VKRFLLLLALTLGLQTSAQPFDPLQGYYRYLTLYAPASKIYFASSGASAGLFITNVSAANAGATPATAGFKFYPLNALDSGDLVFTVSNANNGSSLFNVAYNGTATTSGAMSVGSTLVAGSYIQSGSIFYGPNNTFGQLIGQNTDAAGNIGFKVGNFTSLTACVDRYIAVFHNDNVTTARARVFTDGTYQNLATVGTAASGTGITAVYSGAVRTFLHKVTITNAALTAAATTDITVATTPVNTRINRVVAEVTQVFTGGSLSAMTIQCGNSPGSTQYLLANSVLSATNTWGDVVAEMGAGVVDATRADFGTVSSGVPGAITVSCRFTCTGANCSAATQGSVTVYVEGVTY